MTTQLPCPVILVTKQPLLVAGFRELLHWAGLGAERAVIGPDDLARHLVAHEPLLVVIDAQPNMDWKWLAHLCQSAPLSRFVLCFSQVTPQFAQAAMESGVHGVLSTKLPVPETSRALLEICHGERRFRWESHPEDVAPSHPRFTRREQQVLTFLLEGMKNREIAAQLGTTEGSVKVYLHRIFRKTGVTSRQELIFLARNAEWRPEPLEAPERTLAAASVQPEMLFLPNDI